MKKANKVELGSVQETLFIPLCVRAVETQKAKPLLIDIKAVEIINSISLDLTFVKTTTPPNVFPLRVIPYLFITRSIYFDNKIKSFIDSFPEATIVNIGCGLDTTFYRIDNGTIQWIDLDLPDTIDLRREYFNESDRNRFIAKSVFDKSWYDSIENKEHVMLLIAGVLYYLDESQVKRLFSDFQTHLPRAEMIFDVNSKLSAKTFNWRMKKAGKSARHIWSNSNVHEIERWNCGLEVIDSVSAYKEHRRDYPLLDRIAMSIFDAIKLCSLAHVKIHPPQD